MAAFEDRLFVDLRTGNASVWKVSKSGVEELYSLEVEAVRTIERLRSEVLDPLTLEIASKKLPVSLVLPNFTPLFKVFSTPVPQSQKAVDLLSYEVEQSFPHENSELIWCHAPLCSDEIEAHHLVAALRSSSFETLISGLDASGISEVDAIPSVFLELAASSSISSDAMEEGLRHLVSLQHAHFFSLSWSAKGGVVRSKTLSGTANEFAALGNLKIPAIRELKRTQSSVKRLLKQERCAAISLSAATADVSWGEHVKLEMNADAETLFEQIPNDFKTLLTSYLRVGRSDSTFKVKPPEVDSRHDSSWPLSVALVLIAAAPFTWVWANARAVKAYERETIELNRSIADNRALSTQIEQLAEDLMVTLKQKESVIREQEQRQAVVSLFKDVQDALTAVGDTWIETLELKLSDGDAEAAFLKMSGKFLVRESNLKQGVRQRALEGAEASLNTLQQTLLGSRWVDSVAEFKVNYAGMDLGVYVVPFSMNLKLGAPFCGNVNEKEVSQ